MIIPYMEIIKFPHTHHISLHYSYHKFNNNLLLVSTHMKPSCTPQVYQRITILLLALQYDSSLVLNHRCT